MTPHLRPSPRDVFVHVAQRSPHRSALFSTPSDYRALLDVLGRGLPQHLARPIAYCLMPDGWELVVGTSDPHAVQACLHRVLATHSPRRRDPRASPMSALPLPAVSDLVRCCRQVERRALQAGLVRRAQDWPWSSLAARLRDDPRLPLVDTPFLSSRVWVDHVNEPDESLRRPLPDAMRLHPSLATPPSRRRHPPPHRP